LNINGLIIWKQFIFLKLITFSSKCNKLLNVSVFARSTIWLTCTLTHSSNSYNSKYFENYK
jgi:hypothetical protein